MALVNDVLFYRYSPENMSEPVLRQLFVGRAKLLESFVKEIETAARKKTPRFHLIIGPRGIGKSHFLVLLYFEIKNKLGSLLIPIKLAEEEYSVFRVSDLFLRVLDELTENILDIRSLTSESEILDATLEKLKQKSKKEGKRYIIFIENLHEIFKQFDTNELQKLRSILQTHDLFSVVASAPMLFEGISEHDQPFYDFFQLHYLEEFSLNEVKELIKKIAEVDNNTTFLDDFKKYELKIHGMMHLTGGSPRLVILFYEMVTRRELEDIEKAFFKIVDEHTPYYQEIFQRLTGQKRRIFDVLISSPTPLTPKALSEAARIDLPTVTTQLRRLENDGYVISRPRGRHTYYEVRERLFRLWREMRQPFGRKRVSLLLEFLRFWYTPEEQNELFKIKFELLEAGEKKVLKDLCYCAEIMPPKARVDALLKLTPKLLELGALDEAAYELHNLKDTIYQLKRKTQNKEVQYKIFLYSGDLSFYEKKYEDALDFFTRALKIKPKNAAVLSKKAMVLADLDRYDEALKFFDMALDVNPKYMFALINKGIFLIRAAKYEEALGLFNLVLELNPKSESALSEKGSILSLLNRYDEALKFFDMALDVNPKSEFVLSGKAMVLADLDRYDEALKFFDMALELNPKDESALLNKGVVLADLNRYEEALGLFTRALEINPREERALLKKGCVLNYLKRYDEALKFFDMALELNPRYDCALVNRGVVLENLKQYDLALDFFNKALEITPDCMLAISHKGAILIKLGRYVEAVNLAERVLATAKNDYSKLCATLMLIEAYSYIGRKTEAILAIETIKDKVLVQKPNLIKGFIELCFNIALVELKAGNLANSDKLLQIAYDTSRTLKDETVSAFTMTFLKGAAESGELSVIKTAARSVLEKQGETYREHIKPILSSIEIVETKDIQKYYNLQIEEREIVADIVQKITRSYELIPPELLKKEER